MGIYKDYYKKGAPVTPFCDEAETIVKDNKRNNKKTNPLRTHAMDANESIFFLLELQHIEAEVVEIEYQELKNRDIIPISMEADPADETIAYYQIDHVGNAKIVIDYANDFPDVTLLGEKYITNVHSIGESYKYSIQEIRAAAKVNRPLTTMKADAANHASRILENNIAWVGDIVHGLTGFLTNPATPVLSLPAVGNVSPYTNTVAWAGKTPSQVLNDLNLIANTIGYNTLGVEGSDGGLMLLLPRDSYDYINSTPRSDYSDMTILEYFLQNNPYIKEVDWLFELIGAGPNGTRLGFCFERKKSIVEQHIPQDFEMFPPQERGMTFVIPCHHRYGGVVWKKPLAAVSFSGF